MIYMKQYLSYGVTTPGAWYFDSVYHVDVMENVQGVVRLLSHAQFARSFCEPCLCRAGHEETQYSTLEMPATSSKLQQFVANGTNIMQQQAAASKRQNTTG